MTSLFDFRVPNSSELDSLEDDRNSTSVLTYQIKGDRTSRVDYDSSTRDDVISGLMTPFPDFHFRCWNFIGRRRVAYQIKGN